MLQMKTPKWKVDKDWALRKAKRIGRLPEEVEKLFMGDPNACMAYSKHLEKDALKGRLPAILEESVCEVLESEKWPSYLQEKRDSRERAVAKWLTDYCIVGRLTERMERLFFKCVESNMDSPYNFGSERALFYASRFPDLPDEYEKLFWKHGHTAIKYAIQSGKRIPPDAEEEFLRDQTDGDDFVSYCKVVFKGRAPESVEAAIIDSPEHCLYYAKEVVWGPLPTPLHSAMTMKSFEEKDRNVSEYFEFIKLANKYVLGTLANFDKNATVREVLAELGDS